MQKKHEEYLAPKFDLIQVNIEQGFAATGDTGHAGDDLGEGPGMDW